MALRSFSTAVAVAIADPILIPPPSSSSSTTALLVWVPGGKVNTTFYQPIMEELQSQLTGKIDLWVSIAECPGNLCIPVATSPMVKNALARGLNASGVDAAHTWMGGHSLGSVEADAYCRHNAGAAVAGGCILMGGYVGTNTGGASTEHMLEYPVPVLQLVAELDFGSARATKMAPFSAWAETKDATRTPVIMVPDVDHSDMCEGFPVEGDLPSSSSPQAAIQALVEPTASFMQAQILDDKDAAASVEKHLEFTKGVMDPINQALAMDDGIWCHELQKEVAGEFATQIGSLSTKIPSAKEVHALSPHAKLSHDGTLDIDVVALPLYEGNWPVGPSDDVSLALAAGPPAVKRNSPTTVQCRVVSHARLAALLNKASFEDSANICRTRNEAALEWARSHVAQRTLDRYESEHPCNSCARGVPAKFLDDLAVEDIKALENTSLTYDLTETELTVASASFVSEDEYSCALLSPARAVDFLMFDSFSASRFVAPTGILV